jgi:hypothetical protein
MAATKMVPNVGKSYFMNQICKAGKVQLDSNATIHLFVSNITPARTDVLSTYSAHEASYGGYASQTLGVSTDGGIDSNFYDTYSWPALTWQATSSSGLPQTIYGYYVVASDAATLLWVCTFAPSITLSNSGDGFTVPVTLSGASIFGN